MRSHQNHGRGRAAALLLLAAPVLPDEFKLASVYPNPFDSGVTVVLELPIMGWVRAVVYDLRGREVARLLDETLSAGRRELSWSPRGVAAGTYLLRVSAAGRTSSRKLIYLK